MGERKGDRAGIYGTWREETQAAGNRRKERGSSRPHSASRCNLNQKVALTCTLADRSPSRAEADSLIAAGSPLLCGAVDSADPQRGGA